MDDDDEYDEIFHSRLLKCSESFEPFKLEYSLVAGTRCFSLYKNVFYSTFFMIIFVGTDFHA